MLVENRMKRDPFTISPETGILEGTRLLRQHKIRHLPVVRGGRLVGILTDRDLKRVSPSPATSLSVYEVNYLLDKLEAKEVMIKQVVTVTPRTTIEDAARLLLTHKIGSLPVVDGEVLVGIIPRPMSSRRSSRRWGSGAPARGWRLWWRIPQPPCTP